MAKTTDIGSKEFSNLLLSLSHQPDKVLIKRIDSKMFPLDNNKIFSYKPEYLAIQEYKRCLKLFQTRNPGLNPEKAILRIAGVQKLIIKAETPIKKELEELCISAIKDIYQIPDYVNIKSFIQPRLSFDSEQTINPKPFLELSLEQKNKMIESIKARELYVGLIHGSSMHSWKGIYHLMSEEINKLNPTLMELYDHYTSLIGIILWQINPDIFSKLIQEEAQLTQGYSEVKSNRQVGFGATVTAYGINLPTLIHECNKGVMSYLFHSAVPQEYNETELEYYYSIGDRFCNEPWHYLLSPTLWVDLLECAKVENEKIPKLIRKLVQLSYQELVELFRLMVDNKEEATKKIQEWNL